MYTFPLGLFSGKSVLIRSIFFLIEELRWNNLKFKSFRKLVVHCILTGNSHSLSGGGMRALGYMAAFVTAALKLTNIFR